MPYLLLFLPLLGSVAGYLAKPLGDRYSEILTTSLVILSAIFRLLFFTMELYTTFTVIIK